MGSNVPSRARIEGYVVRVGVSDAVWAQTLSSAFAFSPVDLPRHHVVLARIVHPTVGSRAETGAVNFGKYASANCDEIASGEIASGRLDAGVLGRKGVSGVFGGHSPEVSVTVRHR